MISIGTVQSYLMNSLFRVLQCFSLFLLFAAGTNSPLLAGSAGVPQFSPAEFSAFSAEEGQKTQVQRKGLRRLLTRKLFRKRSNGGRILSILSLVLGITGTILILISFLTFSGLLLFITGAFLTLNAVWLAILSLINLDQQHDKPFWWISFGAMCLALLPTLFAMAVPLLVILVLTALGWAPERFF